MDALSRARQFLGLFTSFLLLFQNGVNAPNPGSPWPQSDNATDKTVFIDNLLNQMTIPDLVLQLHLMFGDNIVGPDSNNELYDFAMRFSPMSPVGNVHDWYPMNTSKYNEVQQLNLESAHLRVPFIHFGECLHGVGSYNQSIFPQNLGMAASFDTDIVYRTARAIGTEARSIGIHACFAPVLDLAQEPRWGRAQENFGEDKVLTSHMGVAYASGLSKNSTWGDSDAVIPVMKVNIHFAAHGNPQSGHNTAPSMIHGNRQVLSEYLMPFKAVVQLGGVRGVMMAYSEVDDVPSAVNPMLYQALNDWGYDGFVIADDTGMQEIQTVHQVANSPADAIGQWFNAGGMIQFYDYPLETFLNASEGLVANGTVQLETIKAHVRDILSAKWDLGLFKNPFITPSIDPFLFVDNHTDIALEAAHKSIVLLENQNGTLPLSSSDPERIALIGPFADIFNFGDYSGPWGQYPVHHASTIRQGILNYLKQNNSTTQLVSSWGSNSWQYNNQYAIPPYHLSHNDSQGGLLATYFANTNFTSALLQKVETPALDWGLYPPPGLPSNNFSVSWEGELDPAVDREVNGWLGVAIGANSSVRLFIDDNVVYTNEFTNVSTIITNIESFTYIQANGTLPPPNSVPFTFQPNVTHRIRIEFATQNSYQKVENVNSLNAQLILFWNLVDSVKPIDQAKDVAANADAIVLAVGDAWNSDGESADRGTLDLAPDQRALAEAMLSLDKPVVLVLQGGRPFAIPDLYNRSAAVLSTYFPGQAAGQAIADVLFGVYNPGGRLPMSIPRHVGQIPVYYNYKPTAHLAQYLDIDSNPAYSFGYGLSYSSFDITSFSASGNGTFALGDTISFRASITNNGTVEGSYVLQVYLLQRYSQIVQPVKQLMAFNRVYLQPGASTEAVLQLDVDRYLPILNRQYEWVLEKGAYTFALLENGGMDVDTGLNVTLQHV